MQAILYAAARTAVQSAWGWAVAHFAVLAIIPQSAAVDFILTAVVIGGATAGLRWLETRKGDSLGARAARFVAKVAMLGLSAKQPVYARQTNGLPSTPVSVTYDSGVTKPAL